MRKMAWIPVVVVLITAVLSFQQKIFADQEQKQNKTVAITISIMAST